ncbi:unnamed protein product [Ranitomeya imitator]|uniref:T-cell receptor alpha chain constant domain-containing protein n=1 Tax=Ranitomeya imitator TaxID=111125 RepID=A0ABN9KY39_9NEOB|nr:unnamed protein product [Ranitomeya imitator]
MRSGPAVMSRSHDRDITKVLLAQHLWNWTAACSAEEIGTSEGTSRTIPSVYRLEADKPNEDLPNTVCLVTDFPKPDTTLTVDQKEIRLNETSVLDKSISDVWRYSAVIWDNDNPSKDLACNVKYDGKDVPQEKKIREEAATTCSSLTVSERFGTSTFSPNII